MLRIYASKSAEAALQYFNDALVKGDYYQDGQDYLGEWGGKTALRLNLTGEVSKESFAKLLVNIHPQTGHKLTPRNTTNRRPGYDFTFDVPKSVSLLYDVTKDRDILAAFRSSVKETMAEMEQRVKTQAWQGQTKIKPTTGNLIYAEFVHFDARPVEGVPDPHLHIHCYVLNTTWYENKQRFQAVELRELKRLAPYFQAVADARFAKKLVDMGYPIKRHAKGWEIDSVPRELINAFSQRTRQIEKDAQKRGLIDAKDKDSLAAQTRDSKKATRSYEEIQRIKEQRLGPEGRALFEQLYYEKQQGKSDKTKGDSSVTPQQAMGYALTHAFERSSVVETERLMAHALQYGVGSVTTEDIQRELQHPQILTRVDGERRYSTTQSVLAEEQAVLKFAVDGKGRFRPFHNGEYKFEHEIFEKESAKDQRNAVLHVLQSHDRVIGIDGVAGGGKTTLMQETIAAIEKNGLKVFVFAPSSKASRLVLRSKGFDNATTVAELTSSDLQEGMRDGVLWIDEASMVSMPEAKRVIDLAERLNCRLILSGDTQQHTAVQRGNILAALSDHAGLNPAQMIEIHRQNRHTHKQYHQAVKLLSEGKADQAFDILDKMGAIIEMDSDTYLGALAKDYVETQYVHKNGTVLVAPTHREGELLTDLIRETLQEKGFLKDQNRCFDTYKNLSWTQAERQDIANFEQGYMVQFTQNLAGISKGERFTITHIDRANEHILMQSDDKRFRTLDLTSAASFNVFLPQQKAFAKGDKIRITRNGYINGQRLNNGTIHRIVDFAKNGDLVLHNGTIVPKDFGHFTYGYCTTSPGSQGMDDIALLSAMGTPSRKAISDIQTYVTVSRGKEIIRLYTDDKEALRNAMKETLTYHAHDLITMQPEIVGRIASQQKMEQRQRAYAAERHPQISDSFDGFKNFRETGRWKSQDFGPTIE